MTGKKSTVKISKRKASVPPEEAVRVSPAAGFPVVGIGASAGGLAAFEAFFSGIPEASDPGMAFVVVQHLAPDHKSLLTELVQRHTRMRVLEVEDDMQVQPNCVYIIPPGRDMAFLNGSLHLLEPSISYGLRLPIDFFFSSLAQDQGERAIGIVLSGTGSDGTAGIRAIHEAAGVVMVQSPDSAEFNGMPLSAIATGLADYVLKPVDMPAQVLACVARHMGKPARAGSAPLPMTENALNKIFVLLRAQTSHDFSQYKPSTIHRRIERRMAVQQIDSASGYVKYLQQSPVEVEALFRDLLIGVTHFFRDPDAFQVLEEQIIPKLFADKPAGSVIRIWTPGCSTGEEAYSIAILLQERMEALKTNYKVQVFATDIDSKAITSARAGVYPSTIASDVSPQRLKRYFTVEPDGTTYRIHKTIRDLLVFSEHDVIKDPPFSRLDLLTCRNLLIYLGAELQKKLIPLFHYALNADGVLFLGTSETVGEFGDLFATLDRKAKLYQRKPGFQRVRRAALTRFLPILNITDAPLQRGVVKPLGATKLPLRELTEKALLQQVAPAGALVNAQGDILYLHGRAGMYLELQSGETSVNNILKMAREGLKHNLNAALNKAVATQNTVRLWGLNVRTNDHFTSVNLSIRPVAVAASETQDSLLYLVVLEEAPLVMLPEGPVIDANPTPSADLPNAAPQVLSDSSSEARIEALKQQLRAKEEFLQTANEELESANEELKSSNEEMQSVNEEMQSTNEELETSKEELQSVNEELATVNAELQAKVTDLSQSNNDMNNLLAGSGIATVFVDHRLCILRFTPAATRIINLIPSDVGRPVAHVVSNLVGYDRLVADTQDVLDTLILKEVGVKTTEGRWYMMRILPYRTMDNVIEGAVITFVDITVLKVTEEVLRKTTEELHRLAVVMRDAYDAITVQDLSGRILAWNPGAVRLYGWSEAEALTMNVRDLIPETLRQEAIERMHQISRTSTLEPYQTQRITKKGALREVSLTCTALVNEAGQVYAISTTERAQNA